MSLGFTDPHRKPPGKIQAPQPGAMPSNWARKEAHMWFEQSLDRKAMRLMGLVHRPEQSIQFADQLVHFRRRLNHLFDVIFIGKEPPQDQATNLMQIAGNKGAECSNFVRWFEEIRHHDGHHASRGRGSDPAPAADGSLLIPCWRENGFEPSVPRAICACALAREDQVKWSIRLSEPAPGDADAAIAHVCLSPTAEPPRRTLPREGELCCLSKIEGGGATAERGTARLRHQPISAGRNPISTLPADSYCARNALLC